MAESSGSSDSTPSRRFQAAVQKNRVLVFGLATLVAAIFHAVGLFSASWWQILAIGCGATASALLCIAGLRVGIDVRLGAIFDAAWIVIDIGFISAAVAASGGANSPWF